jgi:hypothetical protein
MRPTWNSSVTGSKTSINSEQVFTWPYSGSAEETPGSV